MNLELYNQKLKTLQQTRDLLEQITPSNKFNDWDLQYVARKELTLSVEDVQVSIISIISEYYQTLSNTLKHFRTSIFRNVTSR